MSPHFKGLIINLVHLYFHWTPTCMHEAHTFSVPIPTKNKPKQTSSCWQREPSKDNTTRKLAVLNIKSWTMEICNYLECLVFWRNMTSHRTTRTEHKISNFSFCLNVVSVLCLPAAPLSKSTAALSTKIGERAIMAAALQLVPLQLASISFKFRGHFDVWRCVCKGHTAELTANLYRWFSTSMTSMTQTRSASDWC